MSALHYAAQCDHIEMVRLLVARGADTKARDGDGQTSADVAASSAVRALIQ
jgi:ankyrin repeat protein